MQQFLVGLDVGSTTVKAIVVDAASDATLWQDYHFARKHADLHYRIGCRDSG